MHDSMKPRSRDFYNFIQLVSEPDKKTPPSIDWGEAVRINSWHGREHELTELERWIIDERCRLIAVVGMGGMGKTALVIKLMQRVQEHFDGIFWLSLRNAPPLETLVTDCLSAFSGHQGHLPQGLEQKLTLLMQYLHTARYLVVLDNLETVLQRGEEGRAGHYLAGYEDYGRFLHLVGEAFHTSCLIITSREKPATLSRLEAKRSPVHAFYLNGLDNPASQKLLQEQELAGSEHDYAALNQHYAGNPLALQLLAGVIHDVFDGDIAAFLHRGEHIFSDIRDLLDEQFERLSFPEKRLLYWLAIGRELVSLDELIIDIRITAPDDNVLEILDFLQRRRSWIERGEERQTFTLQPVIMEYVTMRLLEQVYKELQTGVFHLLSMHALMKAQSKDVIRNAQQRLILQPLLDRLLLAGRKQAEQLLFQALSTLQHETRQERGYAAGNILNLLASFTSDLRGHDFSHLTIRHAYLQEVDLRDANFAGSAITSSAFTGAFGTILSLAVSPDETKLAVGTTRGDIWVWDIHTGILLFSCEGHRAWVMSVAFNADGTMLASGGGDHCVKLWDLQHGQHFRTLQEHSREVSSVLFSPNGKLVASGSYDQCIILWDFQAAQQIKTLRGHSDQINTFAFSPDGKLLASGGDERSVRLWEVETGLCLRVWQGHAHKIETIVFSSDGHTVISADAQAIRTWDIATGNYLAEFNGKRDAHCSTAVHAMHSAILVASADAHTIELYDAGTHAHLKTLDEHNCPINQIVFSPGGTFLASVSNDQQLKIWEVQSGHCLKTLQGYTNPVWALAFHPDGTLFASGGDDCCVRIWDVGDGRCLTILQGHTNGVTALAFSADGRFLASGGWDESVRIWEAHSGRCLKTLQGHGSTIWSLAFSPDGSKLLCGCHDQSAKVWDMRTDQCLYSLPGQAEWADAIAVASSPQGMLLATSSMNLTINVWNIASGMLLYTLAGQKNPIWSLAFNADGSLLASGSGDQSIMLWSMASGERLHTLRGHEGWISAMTFCLDGNVLASGCSDQCVNLWDVHTGQLVATLRGHSNRVTAVTLNPTGNMLISSDFDEHIIQWNGKVEMPIRIVRIDRPYERMNITDITGITGAQKSSLKALGAIESVQQKEIGFPKKTAQKSISLTRREQDILRLIRDGYTNNEIERALYVSKATVKTHINHLFAKLGVQDRAQALVIAQQLNLLP